ncbi:response regulator [Roseibacillus ishigakijimensis]|uniref:Response regulator n=1 Tax=Roseibacillus ishigakijimensis TaxID=454146 RepID=A0A934RS94_9BACT|nr:response regulator [Roseibacillus ishigakijimensis]MBK1833295.1 response regulator [Roseibacillus ishigakijimensis]
MSETNATSSLKDYYVLFVDDEEKTQRAFSRLFGGEFKILLAGDGAEGFEIFKERQDEIGVIVTDQKMPRQTGVQFLAKVAEMNNDVVRILSTAYAELDAAVAGVNEGGIYRYVTKPWDVPELEITLRRAMELFLLRKEQAVQRTSGTLDIDQLIFNQRVTGLAFNQAANAESVPPAYSSGTTVFLGMLGWQGLGDGEPVDWTGRYLAMKDFFQAVYRETSENLAGRSELDWSRPTPPTAAIEAAAVGCTGLSVETGDRKGNWPGPAPQLAETLRPLMLAFSQLIARLPDGACDVIPDGDIVDFRFSGVPLKDGQLLLASDPEGTPVLASLLGACLQVASAGGHLSLVPSHNGLHLRLEFEEGAAEEDAGLLAVQQLAANS